MRIETERLIIRDFLKEDYKDVFEYLSDAVVMKYIEPIFTIPQTKEFIKNYGIKEKMVFCSKLLNELEILVKEQGAQKIDLSTTYEENHQKFYSRLGFKKSDFLVPMYKRI